MLTVLTIGHSTRDIDEFIDILKSYSITVLVDIRTIPKSRHNPQYVQSSLKHSLGLAGMEYVYLKSLGGPRPASKSSTNNAWRFQSNYSIQITSCARK